MSTTPTPWTPGTSAEARPSVQAGDELLEQLKAKAGQATTVPASKERRLLGGIIDYVLMNAIFFGIDRFMLANAGVLDASPSTTAFRTAATMTTLIAAGY